MKENRKLLNLLGVGLDSELAQKAVEAGYTLTKLKNATKSDLYQHFDDHEADLIWEKVKRKPIPESTMLRLVAECDWKCCVCQDYQRMQPVVIHHIEEHTKTGDDSYDNLVVLCLNHHAWAHSTWKISRHPLPRELIRNKKEEWIKAVAEIKAGIRPALDEGTASTGTSGAQSCSAHAYGLFVRLEGSLHSLVAFRHDPLSTRLNEVTENARAFLSYFGEHDIYFSDELRQEVEKLDRLGNTIWKKFSKSQRLLSADPEKDMQRFREGQGYWIEATEETEKVLIPLMRNLRNKLRSEASSQAGQEADTPSLAVGTLDLAICNQAGTQLENHLDLSIPIGEPENKGKAAEVGFRLYLCNRDNTMARYIQITACVKARFFAYPYTSEPLTIETANRWQIDKIDSEVYRCFFEGGGDFVCYRDNPRDLGVVKMLVPYGEANGGPVAISISYSITAEKHGGSGELIVWLRDASDWR